MQELLHHSDHSLDWFLPSSDELFMEGFDVRLEFNRHEGRHEQGSAKMLIAGLADTTRHGDGSPRFVGPGIKTGVGHSLCRFHVRGQDHELG